MTKVKTTNRTAHDRQTIVTACCYLSYQYVGGTDDITTSANAAELSNIPSSAIPASAIS